MSSIFGFVNTNQQPVVETLLERMRKKLAYWEADSTGKYLQGIAGLGNLGLYNTVEALGTQQPLTDVESRLTITADARIDNRSELFAALEIPKAKHSEISDAELILLSYKKWGKGCPGHLFGDFAFAIWDPVEQALFCARDHLGVKPLFYYHGHDQFVFSSEIKGILALPGIEPSLDNQWCVDAIVMVVPDKTSTLYKNIYRLPPAHAFYVKDNQINKEKYWQAGVPQKIYFKDRREYGEAMREQLFRAVECRLRSPKAVSSELSGGLDSGIITSLAHDILHKQGKGLFSYSHALTEEQLRQGVHPVDESEVINQLIQTVGLTGHEYVTSKEHSFFDTLHSAMHHLDEPLRINFNIWASLIHKRANERDSGVLLSGLGGDELVTYHDMPAYQSELWKKGQWKTLWDMWKSAEGANDFRAAKKLVRFIMMKTKGHNASKSVPKWLFDHLPFKGKYLEQNDLSKRWLDKAKRPSGGVFEQQVQRLQGGSLYDRLENGNLILKPHKMEYRYPLLDVRLIEFCLALPLEQQFHQGQRASLVKMALKDVFPGNLYEKKNNSAFTIPYGYDWLVSDKPVLLLFLKEIRETGLLFTELDYGYIELSINDIEKGLNAERNPMPSVRSLFVLMKLHQLIRAVD